jgi:hypothetical protein
MITAAITTLTMGAPAAHAAITPQDTDIRVIGGAANAAIICGNIASADDLGRRRGIPVQKSKCTAKAVGGSVLLENVDIIVAQGALAAHANDPVLAALGVVPQVAGVAQDNCNLHQRPPGPGVQLNKCLALAHGGRLNLNGVSLVSHQPDGTVSTRTVDNQTVVVPLADGGASAACSNIVSDPLEQRDDCTGVGGGAAWSMSGVDAVIHNANGTTTTRHGITVEVRGGAARSDIFCFNITDGQGRVIQVNVCKADSQGGDATLRNVTIQTS